MLPVLFEVFGFPINSYGLSKALAALTAAYLLGRQFRRRGWNPDQAWTMVMMSTVLGFVGATAANTTARTSDEAGPHDHDGSGGASDPDGSGLR